MTPHNAKRSDHAPSSVWVGVMLSPLLPSPVTCPVARGAPGLRRGEHQSVRPGLVRAKTPMAGASAQDRDQVLVAAVGAQVDGMESTGFVRGTGSQRGGPGTVAEDRRG